ncbi:TIGR03089 family protein [Corynebacterium sp. TAE3-ERU12]|uniref:TIGR03089 family protein n=1 Tax=Corynebacterium sp. TAE3-ERU12 TaxID=2849491 RepID=UPI0021021177|nr:TIGR03089 family protein [Corynebacterium sp. TAE3-ERU12]
MFQTNPGAPRLTCYDEVTGGRTDLSSATLDNWASKTANFLHEELDLEAGDTIWIDLPLIWPAGCIIAGALRAGVELSAAEPMAVFTTVANLAEWENRCPDAVLCAVTDDAFGRGVVECGGEIPPGVIDFGPEVRMYADDYLGAGAGPDQPVCEGQTLDEIINGVDMPHGARVLFSGERLDVAALLAPWAADGSVVAVRGGDDARCAEIAEREKVTQ